MQNRELILYHNQIHRILALADHKALLINCIKLTMPKWINADLLNDCDSCTEEDLLKAANLPVMDSLSPEKKSLVHKRYTMIAPALIVVADEYMRTRAIEQAVQQYSLSHQTIRKYLCLYLAYQRLEALVQGETNFTKPLSADEKNFRWAINKYYYSPAKHTLKAAYLFMLKEKYTDPNGTLVDQFPAFHRFRYFYDKTKKLQNFYITREGLTSYQRNHRALLGGGVREFAPSVGVGMLDATILDIYLINEEGQLIGRPVLTACVDAYSGMCCGYSLSWEGGVYSLKCLMDNIIADKVDWCKKFGICIKPEDWNCNALPGTFVTDKGKEYTSYIFEQLTDLGVSIINLQPYRPDLKSCVEQFFNVIQNLYKPDLKGKGVIEPDYMERGAPDYRKTACLTMRDLETVILKCIIYYNTKRLVDSFTYTEEMRQCAVKPYANCLWNYAADKPGANLIDVSVDMLHLTLLPRGKAAFTKRGLIFNKLRYRADGYAERYLCGGDCLIAYDPEMTSHIWLIENGNYIKFTLIDRQYNDCSFAAACEDRLQSDQYVKGFAAESMQARIDLMSDIQAVADQCSTRTGIDITAVRKNRSKEKTKRRLEH